VLLDVGHDALEQPAGAAVARVLEGVVRPPAGVVAVEDHVAQHARERRQRHALADPLLVHHARLVRPHLEVVGHHEVLGEPGAELLHDELLEVLDLRQVERLTLRLDEAEHALEHDFLRQVLDVVLQRVRQEAPAHPDPRLAHQLLVLVAHQLVEQAVEVLVVREQDVPADVVREAVRARLARCQAPDLVACFDDPVVAVAQLRQAVGGGEPGRAGP
jgi:hypothetical protein